MKIDAIGKFPEIEIDEKRFLDLKLSRSILTEALAIEEKYEILISNYLELEKESLNASVSEMVRDNIEYSDFFDLRLALNIRLVNLLTSVRLYTNQLSSHTSKCVPNMENSKEVTKSFFSAEYDKNSDYRFMEALRNHMQHSSMPVHRISTGSKWTELENGLLEYSIYFATQKRYLVEDGGFKKKVLDEMPDEVNLRAASRSYVESISLIHEQARSLIRESVTNARTIIESAIDEYKEVYKESFVGLHAYAFDGKSKKEETPLFLNWDDIRIRLEKRNRKLINLRKRYATGQAHNK